MEVMNLQFAWLWFLAGIVSGSLQGLFFHREGWLAGYGSWRRRLTRLGHISFFGTGLLNLAFFLSILSLQPHSFSPTVIAAASIFLLLGAVTMPLTCYLAAWRQPLRHLFPLPVLSLGAGIGVTALLTLTDST